MLYFYYGDNLYDLEAKLDRFAERYEAKYESGLNLWRIDCEEEDTTSLRQTLETHSMFEEKKLIFLRGAFSYNKDARERLVDLFTTHNVPASDEVVVVVYEKQEGKALSKKKPLFTYLSKNAQKTEFTTPRGSAFTAWLTRRAREHEVVLSRSARNALAERVGEDTLRLAREIEKLSCYASGREVGREDVERLVPSDAATDVFKTVDALARRDIKDALGRITHHRIAGDDPISLLGMIAYELRVLVTLREALDNGEKLETAGRAAGLHPFVIKKNSAAAKNFSLAELHRLHTQLTEADVAVKTGEREPFDALEDVVYQIAR